MSFRNCHQYITLSLTFTNHKAVALVSLKRKTWGGGPNAQCEFLFLRSFLKPSARLTG